MPQLYLQCPYHKFLLPYDKILYFQMNSNKTHISYIFLMSTRPTDSHLFLVVLFQLRPIFCHQCLIFDYRIDFSVMFHIPNFILIQMWWECDYEQGWQTLCKEQTVNILFFVAHAVSVQLFQYVLYWIKVPLTLHLKTDGIFGSCSVGCKPLIYTRELRAPE